MGDEIVRATPGSGSAALAPQSIQEALKMAELMASAKLVPAHLRDSPGDCLLVINQAVRWGLDPLAVAQATAVVQGKLCYEGKLVAAVLVATGAIKGRPDYTFSGSGDDRTITISAMAGDGKVRTITGTVRDWKSNNRFWNSQPDDMLIYRGIRQWARRYAPEAVLGILTPDEMLEEKNHTPPPAKGTKPPVPVVEIVQEPRPAAEPESDTVIDADEVVHDDGDAERLLGLIAEAETLQDLEDVRLTLKTVYGSDVPKVLREEWTNRKKAIRSV
jgi:hypothetical protein